MNLDKYGPRLIDYTNIHFLEISPIWGTNYSNRIVLAMDSNFIFNIRFVEVGEVEIRRKGISHFHSFFLFNFDLPFFFLIRITNYNN